MRRIDLKRANVARPNTVRDINRQIILNVIREKEPISRGEIAQQTALHRATISTILDGLLGEDLIEEVGAGESRGGRPPILLRLRAGGPVAVGVDLGTARTVVATADLAGRVLEQEEFATDPDISETLRRVSASVLRLVGRKKRGVEGVGLSMPGLVDHETGSALFIPHFKWRDWPVASEIEDATGLPVTVDNDANAAALAELWFGRPEVHGVRDFVLVLVAEGIGTGMVFDGQIYRGEGGGAGEFGHTTVGEGAPVACAAGSRRCWEAFASERAALARYEMLTRRPPGRARPKFTQLVDGALEGDGAARTALVQTAHYLGLGISNLISGLSPEAIIIGGPVARAWPLIVGEITQVVEENRCLIRPSVRIIASTLGEQPKLLGAVSLVLASKFAVAHAV
ncbi:MAG TPA: ROK family transcriptional regulator [Pyrinomonadaceae bacterium]|nr:ROK family transcriptional regulator [Pyrinomonadaceae bacterium]